MRAHKSRLGAFWEVFCGPSEPRSHLWRFPCRGNCPWEEQRPKALISVLRWDIPKGPLPWSWWIHGIAGFKEAEDGLRSGRWCVSGPAPSPAVLNQGQFYSPGNIWPCLETFEGSHWEGVLLGTVGRSWDAVSIIKCTRWPPKQWPDPDVDSA